MNLTWHIVKKDLRALRWPIGCWLLCIVSKLGVGVLLLTASGEEGASWFQQMDLLAKGLAVGELLSFVLVAALIQEDLMVGTTAFWMTRPISGGRLLRAKLYGIGLVFLVAPVLVTLPWWLGCNYGLDEIAWAAGETLAVHAIVVLAALLWSAVTDGLGRFVMWSLVTLVTMPMITAIISYYLRRKGSLQIPEIMSTRLLVAVAILLVGVGVMLVHQYLTRRTWRSIGVIGGTVFFATLALALWPWAWNLESRTYTYLIRRAQGEWPASAEPSGLTFSLNSAKFTAAGGRSATSAVLNLRYRVDGLGESQGLIAHPYDYNFEWSDGTSEKGYGWGRSVLNWLAQRRAKVFVKGGTPASDDDREIVMSSFVPSTTMGKVRAQTPAYKLNARFRLMKYESTRQVPIQAGDWEEDGPTKMRIAAVEKVGDEQHVTFVRHAPALWVDAVGGGQMAPVGVYSRYFLVNRRNGWVDEGRPVANESHSTRIGTVEIAWQTLYYHASLRGGGKPTLEGINALNDAELIKVSFSEQARFSHEFRVEAERLAEALP